MQIYVKFIQYTTTVSQNNIQVSFDFLQQQQQQSLRVVIYYHSLGSDLVGTTLRYNLTITVLGSPFAFKITAFDDASHFWTLTILHSFGVNLRQLIFPQTIFDCKKECVRPE